MRKGRTDTSPGRDPSWGVSQGAEAEPILQPRSPLALPHVPDPPQRLHPHGEFRAPSPCSQNHPHKAQHQTQTRHPHHITPPIPGHAGTPGHPLPCAQGCTAHTAPTAGSPSTQPHFPGHRAGQGRGLAHPSAVPIRRMPPSPPKPCPRSGAGCRHVCNRNVSRASAVQKGNERERLLPPSPIPAPCPAGGRGLRALLHAFGGAFCSALEPARPFSVLSLPEELTRHSFLGESTRLLTPPTPKTNPPSPAASPRDWRPHSLPILHLLDDEEDDPLDEHEEDEEAEEPPHDAHDDERQGVVRLLHCRGQGAEGPQDEVGGSQQRCPPGTLHLTTTRSPGGTSASRPRHSEEQDPNKAGTYSCGPR